MTPIVHTDEATLARGCERCHTTEARALIDSGSPSKQLCIGCFEHAVFANCIAIAQEVAEESARWAIKGDDPGAVYGALRVLDAIRARGGQ